MQCFVVEWYGPPAMSGPLADAVKRLSSGRDFANVRHMLTVAIADDECVFGIFAADSAVAVEWACVDAGARPDRISTAVGWMGAGAPVSGF
jgi:hypothetical protein